MKGYKAFSPGMICKDKQYEENSIATETQAIPCKAGIHFCENPFDVLEYYPLVDENGNFSEFAEVEALDEPATDDGKKFCSTRLKIGVKLSFAGFVKACIEYIKENTTQGSSGNSAKIGSSGYSAQITSTGEDSVIMCAGIGSIAKAKKGSWITLSEWRYDRSKHRQVPVCVKTEQVDGDRIKEDVFYKLEDGKFVEV